MADRILRWYIDGNIARTKTQVGGTHTLDADYRPICVRMNCRVAATGSGGTEVDILDDGVSILANKAVMDAHQTDKTWDTIAMDVLREDSQIRLDITDISTQGPARDLTVELELELV